MLAISQSGTNYFFMNWVPSESGPLVTQHGYIQKDLESPDRINEHYFGILNEIFTSVHNGDPICTFSLDSNSVLFSSCYAENNNEEMISWHLAQARDEELNSALEYYHYSFNPESGKILNIGIPKAIRQSFKRNMSLLKLKLNGLSVGIFSAETGARKWMKAEKNENYLIWKIGKKKMDELLFIRNGELATYFSFHRKGSHGKIMWQFGDATSIDLIIQDIVKIQNGKAKKFNSVAQVYLYTSEGNLKDVKSFQQMGIENLTLLNPLSVLKTGEDEEFHQYNTLPLAETGNAFGGIDV